MCSKKGDTCSCGKHFYEKYSFLPRYFQHTSKLTAFLADSLHKNQSIKELSLCQYSPSTVHRILDILPDRTQGHLVAYFSSVQKAERYRVKYFICDMWTPYTELAKIYFPHAKIIIDKYHFIRQVT